MSNRGLLFCGIGLSMVTLLLLLLSLGRGTRAVFPQETVQIPEVTVQSAPLPAEPRNAPEEIGASNLFSPSRGKPPPPPPDPPAPPPDPPPAPAPEPALNMLGAYPGDWPRLMLTGVYNVNGELGALITGGDNFTVSSGEQFPRLYRRGEAIGSGISLAQVEEFSVVLCKGNDGLRISLGIKPPDPPKKD